jgi:formate/nitrite transporter FocA (FNT family)
MDNISTHILGILIGILICTSVFMFMALIIFVKKGFVIVFQNIDALVKRINSFLDSSNKNK